MLHRLRCRVKFLLKSSNQHGVHSPFVYRYLTQGVYQTKKDYSNLSKQERLLQATLAYFQIQEVLGDPPPYLLIKHKPRKIVGKHTYKYLYYISNIALLNQDALEKLVESIDEETLLYIAKPYVSKRSIQKQLWLYTQSVFHVSMDFYFAGILATRIEQKKEHFTLRM